MFYQIYNILITYPILLIQPERYFSFLAVRTRLHTLEEYHQTLNDRSQYVPDLQANYLKYRKGRPFPVTRVNHSDIQPGRSAIWPQLAVKRLSLDVRDAA